MARPPTSTISTGGGAPSTSAATGSSMPGVVEAVQAPQRDVGELAGLERAELVLATQAARALDRRQRERLARTSSRPGRRRGARQAAPGAPRRPAPPPRWTPRRRRPRPTGAPARTRPRPARCRRPGGRWSSGSAPRRCRVAPNRTTSPRRDARSARARRRRRASRGPRGTGPAAPRSAPGRTPPRRASRPGGCAAARRAASELRGLGHELGRHREGRARRERHPRTSRPARGRGSDRWPPRWRPGSRRGPRRPRRAAARRPSAEVHRPAARVKAYAEGARGLDLDLAAGRRPEGRRSGGRSPSSSPSAAAPPGPRGPRPLDLAVDVRPDRIELDQPLEQRGLLGQATRGPLVEVVVAVDQPGRGQAAPAVDARSPSRRERARRRPRRCGRPR